MHIFWTIISVHCTYSLYIILGTFTHFTVLWAYFYCDVFYSIFMFLDFLLYLLSLLFFSFHYYLSLSYYAYFYAPKHKFLVCGKTYLAINLIILSQRDFRCQENKNSSEVSKQLSISSQIISSNNKCGVKDTTTITHEGLQKSSMNLPTL